MKWLRLILGLSGIIIGYLPALILGVQDCIFIRFISGMDYPESVNIELASKPTCILILVYSTWLILTVGYLLIIHGDFDERKQNEDDKKEELETV